MSKTRVVEGWPPEGSEGGASGGGSVPRSALMAGGLLAVFVLFLAVMALTGKLGLANVGSREVAVKVNYLTGSQATIITPGYQFYMPLFQEIYIFDRSQQRFVMEGAKYLDDNHVPQLTVRASDGSSYYFEEMPIQYQIQPATVETLLTDAGPDDEFKREWIKAYARSILRDEFGRFTAVDAADPTLFARARQLAKGRLNEALKPHGIEVVLLGTPNPKFPMAYEAAIEERKGADQEVERLAAKLEQLVEEREQKLASVERKKSVEMQELEGTLTKALLESERMQIELERGADAFAAQRVLEGQALESEKTEQARGLVARYTKEAEGIAEQAAALEKRGSVVVREALIKKLQTIKFTFVPYSRDPAPKRLEHVNALGAQSLVDETTLEGNQ